MKDRAEPKYKMTVAGQLFKHLGLQMYSGAVPAIVELISNAYDAMAKNVWIEIPVGRSIKPNDVIEVRDDGHGMSFEECNKLYLSVGRDRRSDEQDSTSFYKGLPVRKVQGRKGIGKLAGFGIANVIEVKTIKSGKVANFSLDFEELTRSSKFADENGYSPKILSCDGGETTEAPGTTIKLSELKISKAINEDDFKKSIARRLLVLDEDFTVSVNKTAISRQEIPFQVRFPETKGGWETSSLENGKEVQWWAGFCEKTIPNEEQRGFVVYVRGKLAQTPWFFDLSGGVWGQHGMQYLTGEVKADFLDEDIDLIATDRGSVRWEDPVAVSLKKWGQKKIKELLESWTDKRREEKTKSQKISAYLEKADKLPDRERKIFKKVVDRICDIPQIDKDKEGKDIADDLVEFVYNALTNRSFLETIRKLNATSTEDIQELNKALSEWDILELVHTANLVVGRVEVIRTFKQLIKSKAREKPDMQDYICKYPWLIDPKWTLLTHEQQLDTILKEEFNIMETSGDAGRQRPDFFCMGDGLNTAYVVEVKRPGTLVGKEEFNQLQEYVFFLRRQLIDEADSNNRRTTVKGLLIADRIKPDEKMHAKAAQDANTFNIRTWNNLLTSAETLHKEFLKVIKKRAPVDDPRIVHLEE